MIPLSDFKRMLGPHGRNLTDEQVKQRFDTCVQIADAVFDKWAKRTRKTEEIALATIQDNDVT